jgi:hypothetical protein
MTPQISLSWLKTGPPLIPGSNWAFVLKQGNGRKAESLDL